MATTASLSRLLVCMPTLHPWVEYVYHAEVTNLAKSQQQFQAQLSENSMVKEVRHLASLPAP